VNSGSESDLPAWERTRSDDSNVAVTGVRAVVYGSRQGTREHWSPAQQVVRFHSGSRIGPNYRRHSVTFAALRPLWLACSSEQWRKPETNPGSFRYDEESRDLWS